MASSLALSVHGPAGVVDLVVPQDAAAVDLAREYAAVAGLSAAPALVTRSGRTLPADQPLVDAGVVTGDLLAATDPLFAAAEHHAGGSAAGDQHVGPREGRPGAASALWVTVAAAAAVLAGWLGARSDGLSHQMVIGLLAAAALTGLVPVGRYAERRAVTAPAFAAAAAFAYGWEPVPERLPTLIGTAALFGAVTAGVVRALDRRADEALKVWMVGGIGLFLLTTVAALLDREPQVVWAVVLGVGMLAARFVPMYAIDVPDHYLLELDRLSVSAWSARAQPPGRRNRTIVPASAVSNVAEKGARLLLAGAVAVFVATALAAPLLLTAADLPIDHGGAQALVLFTGAALLLAARSYRYAAARTLLRLAGLACWAALLATLLDEWGPAGLWTLALVAVVLAAVLVVAAVATGRGWRSAWWSRRAEVAEGLCGAAALAALVVATGLVRSLWESGISV
ncbi:hypothetical protein [Nocardioides insulae]|uniref:hypothetical protein n=1 Tax=Nocardioides insulae TaxID=394734 RepID=UPI00146A5CD9|nr:hypothetical protein [Nocardioides insulae]